jgi:small subunit ribosomal protein S4
MARYTGPKTRIARKFGDPIYGPDKHLERKNYPPGQHGMNKKRKKTMVLLLLKYFPNHSS